jgi:hypothetical protein
VRILGKGRSVTRNLVVDGLVVKRAELAGIIADLERQLAQHRADLTHIDGVLRVLASDLHPETIKPKRVYRRTRYFARNELSRLCLNVRRVAAGDPVTADFVAGQVIKAKAFDLSDRVLRAAIADQVGQVLKRLRHRSIVERIGAGTGSKWKLAGA